MSTRKRRKTTNAQDQSASTETSSTAHPVPATDTEPSNVQATIGCVGSSTTPSEDTSCVAGLSEEVYLQERSTLINLEQKNAEQHDKAVLAISMGGLALSITFLKEIAPHPLPESLVWVKIAWSMFVASLLAVCSPS